MSPEILIGIVGILVATVGIYLGRKVVVVNRQQEVDLADSNGITGESVDLGSWFNVLKRARALRMLRERYGRLAKDVADEGARVQSYQDFDTLIARIKYTASGIIHYNSNIQKPDEFWPITKPAHEQLCNEVTKNLADFDTEYFNEYHQRVVDEARDTLKSQIRVADNFFNAEKRESYLETLQQTQPELGKLEGFTTTLLETMSVTLLKLGRQ